MKPLLLFHPVMMAPFPEESAEKPFLCSAGLPSVCTVTWVSVGRPAARRVRLADWQCTRVQLDSSCLRVRACALPTGDSVWAYWRTNCADTACQNRSACLHPALAARRASFLLCCLLPSKYYLPVGVQTLTKTL